MGALSFVVLAWSSWGGTAPLATSGPDARTLVDGLVSGIFIAGAVIAALACWRRPDGDTVHIVAVSLGMGCVASGHMVHLFQREATLSVSAQLAIVLLGATQVAATGVALHRRALPRPAAYLLVATVLAVLAGFGVLVGGGRATAWDAAAALALAAVGAAWAAAAWSCFEQATDRLARQDLEVDQALSDQVLRDQALLAEAREQRERLHELRSTVAGLVNGSEMLEHGDLPVEVRVHLWESVRRELERMQRLLSDRGQAITAIDLDDALGVIADLQRLKGRQVEVRTRGDLAGDVVQARYDSLAEVVNILVDNAATHGGTDSSVVEVVRRDEGMVDITVTDLGRGIPDQERERIFEWGERGADSPGEGIGLNLAQRLVAEDGGSLRLAEKVGPGSSFVISLPAPRHSVENDLVDEDGHDSWRRSG